MSPVQNDDRRGPSLRTAGFVLLLVTLGLGHARGNSAGADVGRTALEILEDPSYQRELQPKPAKQRQSGCDGKIRVRSGGPSTRSSGVGSVFTLLAWIGIGVVLGLILIWAASVFRRHRTNTKGEELASADAPSDPSEDPSLEAVRSLASQGRFADAVHELLRIAVQRLATRRKLGVSGWLTSRELTGLLPQTEEERTRFSLLVSAVERSVFGGQEVDRTAYERCFEALRGIPV